MVLVIGLTAGSAMAYFTTYTIGSGSKVLSLGKTVTIPSVDTAAPVCLFNFHVYGFLGRVENNSRGVRLLKRFAGAFGFVIVILFVFVFLLVFLIVFVFLFLGRKRNGVLPPGKRERARRIINV